MIIIFIGSECSRRSSAVCLYLCRTFLRWPRHSGHQQMKDEEYHCLYSRCKRRPRHNNYETWKHQQWCYKYNLGVPHFVINPEMLNIWKIRFDIFHCIYAVIIKIVNFITLFRNKVLICIQNLSYNISWVNSCHHSIFCCDNKCNFSSFKGNVLK